MMEHNLDGQCGVDAVRVGCSEAEIDEVTQIWNSTPLGPTLCAEANAHFSTFF